jgi:hypothetical protein
MKNLKKLLLLGVMLVNVMPYINNGKVEWKTTQAEAQYYTIEEVIFENQIAYLCGDYSYLWYTFLWDTPCEGLNPPPPEIDPDGICSPESSFEWGIGSPTNFVGENHNNWCVFYVLNALDGKAPCIYAKEYYYGTWQDSAYTNFCNIDDPVSNDCISSLYASNGVTVSDQVSLTASGNDEKSEQLLKLMVNWGNDCEGDRKGILLLGGNHVSLAYGFRKLSFASFGETWVDVYNTMDTEGDTWMHPMPLSEFVNLNNTMKFVKKQ